MTIASPDLQTAVDAFFGRPVEIGERARDALLNFGSVRQLWKHELAIRGHLEIFARLVAHSPASAQALMAAGLNLSVLPQVSDLRAAPAATCSPSIIAPQNTRPDNLFPLLFHDPWGGQDALSPGGVIVRDCGLLTETDLLAGYLSSAQISLKPNVVVRHLLSELGHVEFGMVAPEGDAILERAETALRNIGYVDPAHYKYQLILFLDHHGQLRVRPFGSGLAGRLHEPRIPVGTFAFRSGLVQPTSATSPFSADAIEELESLIHSAATKEHDYQRFFERNPRFLSGLEFGRVFPHPILHKDDGSTLIPDFFLEKIDARGHAILDLKASSAKLAVRRKNRVYFAQWVQEAIAQLRYYRDWFESKQNRDSFMLTLGLDAEVFRPRLVLVGGRHSDFSDEVERLRLLSGQDGLLELWTYDDLIERARRYRQFAAGL